MRNQYPGNCKDCGKRVEAGEGYFEWQDGILRRWAVRCVPCAAQGREASGKPLSLAQEEAMRKTP